jgi:hypothetical protein
MGQAGWSSLPDPATPVFFVFLLFCKFFSMNGNFYILSKNIYLYLDYYPFSLLFSLESLI